MRIVVLMCQGILASEFPVSVRDPNSLAREESIVR